MRREKNGVLDWIYLLTLNIFELTMRDTIEPFFCNIFLVLNLFDLLIRMWFVTWKYLLAKKSGEIDISRDTNQRKLTRIEINDEHILVDAFYIGEIYDYLNFIPFLEGFLCISTRSITKSFKNLFFKERSKKYSWTVT